MSTSIRLSAEIEKRLETLAKKTGRTKAFYIRELIEDNITELEDYYLAADTLARVRSKKEKTHASASMREHLGLAD
ncbi:MAG: ribbon-helix-helix protein, CopG family [Cyanobacteria bacterium SZAS TMP-1]|nr:ribbon-helix-helix protein, CopG family [Cyanobacteria bacterium SZAS TMP-1]